VFLRRWELVWLLVAAIATTASGCTGQDARLRKQREAFASLHATTERIGEAWLAGNVSGTYTYTAFEETLRLLDDQRASLTASPQALADARGGELSQNAERLSRLLALLMADVRRSDGSSARTHLAELSALPSEID
jgi:hypothetical protein